MAQKSLLLKLAGCFVRLFYRIHVSGMEKLPQGGFLLLPNHVTWIDAVLLQAASPRVIRFLVYDRIYNNKFLNPVFRLMKAVPISSQKASSAVKKASELLKGGEIVCIFPEGQLSRTGTLLKLRRGYEVIARAAGTPVVPVWLGSLWGSIFSFEGKSYFRKMPKRIPYPVTIRFGEALAAEEAGIATVREKLLALGEEAFQQRPFLKRPLSRVCVKGLRKGQFDVMVLDGIDGVEMSRGTILAAGIAFSRVIRRDCPHSRVGIALPPGRAAVVANLAVVLAGKVPVNLNFTAGHAAVEAANRIAGLEDVITAAPLLKRMPDLPLPEKVILIDKVLSAIKPKVAFWRAMVLWMPAALISALLRLPKSGDHDEAVVLFTSGSSGDPKGVVLSHRNLLGNVAQFGEMLSLQKSDTILASLPFFHSFGCTVTLWFPLIERLRIVTFPNPLDVDKNAALIEREKISLVLATPTFLRGYLRKATREQLAPVKLLVTGAEKLPRDLAEAFREKFGIPIMEGYGLTETSPVVSVNLPEPPKSKPEDEVQPSARLGSVGKLAPGIAAEIRNPETGAPLSLHETGMLWVRGPNIFEGYLNDPVQTAKVIKDGWFQTGDLARFDEDGFLYIEGRISRFSKIGGEMVPHETLEAKICEVLGKVSDDERVFAIVGVPDPAKGEAIILLAAEEVDLPALRTKLLEAGVPALWIPRQVRRVAEIPHLGSGKLDLKRCKEAALAPASEAPSSPTASA